MSIICCPVKPVSTYISYCGSSDSYLKHIMSSFWIIYLYSVTSLHYIYVLLFTQTLDYFIKRISQLSSSGDWVQHRARGDKEAIKCTQQRTTWPSKVPVMLTWWSVCQAWQLQTANRRRGFNCSGKAHNPASHHLLIWKKSKIQESKEECVCGCVCKHCEYKSVTTKYNRISWLVHAVTSAQCYSS